MTKIFRNQLYISILIISTIIGFTGCFKSDLVETNCPGFPSNELVWFPYKSNSVIKFSNGIDTIQLSFSNYYISQETNYVELQKVDCVSHARFKTVLDTSLLLKIEYEGLSNSYGTHFNLKFNNYNYVDGYTNVFARINTSLFELSENQLKDTNLVINGLEINNTIYNNVIKLEIDTVNVDHEFLKIAVNCIYFAKSVGLLQFDDFITKTTWKIIN